MGKRDPAVASAKATPKPKASAVRKGKCKGGEPDVERKLLPASFCQACTKKPDRLVPWAAYDARGAAVGAQCRACEVSHLGYFGYMEWDRYCSLVKTEVRNSASPGAGGGGLAQAGRG